MNVNGCFGIRTGYGEDHKKTTESIRSGDRRDDVRAGLLAGRNSILLKAANPQS
jgi:hypothetical protein